ncbi:MAG: SH3 domain-containing protein [Anaerolineae bacterium]
MDTFWKSNLGKLFLGGCGTQVGLVFAFAAFAGVLAFCSVCALSNALSIVMTQQVASLSTNATATAVSSAEAEALQGEIESLVSQVEVLRANASATPAANPASPSSSQPFVIAHKGEVNLRGGPGISYNKVGTLALGGRLEIVGRNADSSWWLVSRPDGLAWVSAAVVAAYDVNDSIPVVSIPALLAWPTPDGPNPAPNSTPTPNTSTTPTAPNSPTPARPSGTPTATAAESRIFVEDTVGYKRLREQTGPPPLSESFSPGGDQIAISEGIKLYLVAGDGSSGRILLADDNDRRPVGGVVWSPDGKYLAFLVDYKSRKCKPCRSVGLVRLSDSSIYFLKTPDNMDSDAPRWTQDGRLLVNVYPGERADGTTYVYDTASRGQVASGVYVLSSSHEGQKWLPWKPGRTWKAGVSERPDTYYND